MSPKNWTYHKPEGPPDTYRGLGDPRPRKLRLMHKATGEVVNITGASLLEACNFLDWIPDKVFWVDLGTCPEGEFSVMRYAPGGPLPLGQPHVEIQGME